LTAKTTQQTARAPLITDRGKLCRGSVALPAAVITRGTRGIGLALGQWFLAHGDRFAIQDIDLDTRARTAALLNQLGQVITAHCDVSDPLQVNNAVSQVEAAFERISALVNNAGVAVFKSIGDTAFAEWRHVMSTHLDGAFLCSQACVPLMLKTGGASIVNIAPISGLRASTLRVAYGTSKAAIIQLTRQQAVELGNVGIRVNAIAPGPVDREMSKLVHSVAIRSDYCETIPLNRYGTTKEIALALGFLFSPAQAMRTAKCSP